MQTTVDVQWTIDIECEACGHKYAGTRRLSKLVAAGIAFETRRKYLQWGDRAKEDPKLIDIELPCPSCHYVQSWNTSHVAFMRNWITFALSGLAALITVVLVKPEWFPCVWAFVEGGSDPLRKEGWLTALYVFVGTSLRIGNV